MATIYPANVGRQWPLYALLKVTAADILNGSLTSGANIAKAMDLPAEYLVLDGAIYVETAFDSTTATVTIGDSGSSTRYGSAVTLKTAATTALTGTPFHSATIANANVAVTWTGTPTVGQAWIYLRYLIPGRANEVQTN